MSRDLLHRRRKISEAKIAQSDTVELVAGQIRVKVDSFALTANIGTGPFSLHQTTGVACRFGDLQP